MTKTELIDELGKIVSIRKRADAAETALKQSIDKLELADGTYEGKQYTLTVMTKVSKFIKTASVLKKLGEEKFLLVVKVVKKELEKYMLAGDIDKCSEDGAPSKAYVTKEK